MPNSKSTLHLMHKFCLMYKLQYTHYFFQTKTATSTERSLQ